MTLDRLSVHFATSDAARSLRGAELGEGELFDALAEALELPDYFGRNWDAFDECLRDLDGPVLLLVRDAASRWEREAEAMRMLVDVWLSAAAERHDLQLVFVWS
ncbi:MAG TPA: barstar family protein [Thermoanaerobaculia bacterium]